MSIIEKENMKFLDGLNKDYIVIESDRINEYIDYIKVNEIKSIYFCHSYYREQNLDLLKELIFIENINIGSETIIDFTGLYCLKNLKTLLIREINGKLDFNFLTSIENLTISINKNFLNWNQLSNLKELNLYKYNPKSKNLQELKNFKKLKNLQLYDLI